MQPEEARSAAYTDSEGARVGNAPDSGNAGDERPVQPTVPSDAPSAAQGRNLTAIRPWWRRQWLSMRRDRFSRRAAALSILGDALRGFRAKYVRRIP